VLNIIDKSLVVFFPEGGSNVGGSTIGVESLGDLVAITLGTNLRVAPD
jgi:hypothetical protein